MGIIIPGEKAGAATGKIGLIKRNKLWTVGRNFKKAFYLVAGPDETEDDWLATIGVPQRGTLYQGAYCLSHDFKEVTPVLNPYTGQPGVLVEVMCEFTNDISADEAEDDNDDPTQRRAKVNWSSEFEEEVLEKDAVTGDPIETEAGEPYIVTHPYPISILEVSRYEQWPFNPLTLLLYGGRLNDVDFYGAPRGSAWLQPIQAPEEEVGGELFVRATYVLKFKIKFDPENPSQFLEDTWQADILQQGTQAVTGLTGEGDPIIQRITDKNGNPIRVKLAEGGTILGEGLDPYYKRVNRLTYTDINDLNLGPFA